MARSSAPLTAAWSQKRARPTPSTAAAAAKALDRAAAGANLSVERLGGADADKRLLHAAAALVERNMRAHAVEAWNGAAKRAELAHADTRLVVLRSKAAKDGSGSGAGGELLGFAAYRLDEEETVRVAYLYELQLEAATRGHGLGTALVREVERVGRAAHVAGIMLTVHTANTAARRFYTDALRFEVAPTSPSVCAPPTVASACGYEVMQLIWDESARATLRKRGEAARRHNFAAADSPGSAPRLKVRCVLRGEAEASRGGRKGRLTQEVGYKTDETDSE